MSRSADRQNKARVLVLESLEEFSPASPFRAYVNSLHSLRPPPRVDIHHSMPIDAIGVEFTHNFPVWHAWMCCLLRIILLRLPAQLARSAGHSKGGRRIPKSFGSPPEDEFLRESALGRNPGGIPTHRPRRARGSAAARTGKPQVPVSRARSSSSDRRRPNVLYAGQIRRKMPACKTGW